VVEVPAHEAVAKLGARLRGDPRGTDRLVRSAEHEPARGRVRLRWLLTDAGLADLANRIPPASTKRVEERALRPLRMATA
jgi:hypothetical protein